MARKPRRNLIASAAAVNLGNPIWTQYVSLDSAWQAELWRLYDCVPEFARAANYVGQACSRCRIYVAEVDDRGQVQREVPESDPVSGFAYSLFGGPEKQAELQNLAGTAMQVSGDFWTVALDAPDQDSDKWFVVQYQELRRMEDFFMYPDAQPQRQFAYDLGDKEYVLREGRDLIYRTWSPHPRDIACAYSPGRSLQMTLVELEILTQYILAQARSRLTSGGVWPLPAELDFPATDEYPGGVEGFMQRLMDTADKNLKNYGTAAQLIPIMFEARSDLIDKIKEPIIFGSILSEQASALRLETRTTVARGMDVAPEIITGMGDANHWNGPGIEQSTLDTVVKPTMTRIVNGATDYYLKPGLRSMGKSTKKYKFWFDTSSLITRPNRLKETLELWQMGLVNDDEVLLAADLPLSAKMSAKDKSQRIAEKVLISDSNMIQIPELRKEAGLLIKNIAPDGMPPGQPGGPPGIAGRAPAPPPPERTLKDINPASQPQSSTLPGAPNNAVPGRQDKQLTASLTSMDQVALLSIADSQVRQALEQVGKKLRRVTGPELRNVPFADMYMHTDVTEPGYARALLNSSFGHLAPMIRDQELGVDATEVREVLTEYCVDLINHHMAHEVRIMRGRLELEGLL